eukprot:scaffold35862_cov27-Tisochrysis_lutea.AAC.2
MRCAAGPCLAVPAQPPRRPSPGATDAGCTHAPSQVAGRLAKALCIKEPPPLPQAARLRSMGGEAQCLHTDFP